MYVCIGMYTYMCICMCVYVCVYMYVCLCMYVFVYVCVCIKQYQHIHAFLSTTFVNILNFSEFYFRKYIHETGIPIL